MAEKRNPFDVKDQVAPALLRIPGVTGVGVGFKTVNGSLTDELAIVVHVDKKRDDIPPDQRVPAEIEGWKTDVAEFKANRCTVDDKDLYDPVIGGIRFQVGNDLSHTGWGTLGAVVVQQANNQRGFLASLHQRYARAQTGPGLQGDTTRDVWQPGLPGQAAPVPGQGAPGYQKIGSLLESVVESQCDACLMVPQTGIYAQCVIAQIGSIAGTATYVEVEGSFLFSDMPQAKYNVARVKKRGWRTGLTKGRFVTMGLNQTIQTPEGNIEYVNFIAVSNEDENASMAEAGDCGSIGLIRKNGSGQWHAFGLLVATGSVDGKPVGLFLPIEPILKRLGIRFCTLFEAIVYSFEEISRHLELASLAFAYTLDEFRKWGSTDLTFMRPPRRSIGGRILTPGGISKPIPPDGPVIDGETLSRHVDRVLSLLSVSELAQTIDDQGVRDRICRTAVEAAIARLQKVLPDTET
jgi:hypothetical protein